ncbi:hypothetical protein V1264_017484 [Littorina saxatilis]|uniref:Iodothyronine deiodinase n=2 Tax=Littorina saxatilis TaxID=31220 RepID=A0AAN9BJ77_9CAEN
MVKLSDFNQVVTKYAGLADFLIVYIQEAHPDDGWAFRNNPFVIKNHRSLEDRLAAARQLEDAKPACPVVVDNMKDVANYVYGALYERLYIVLNGRIVYAGERGPGGYRVNEVEEWLAAYQHSKEPVS